MLVAPGLRRLHQAALSLRAHLHGTGKHLELHAVRPENLLCVEVRALLLNSGRTVKRTGGFARPLVHPASHKHAGLLYTSLGSCRCRPATQVGTLLPRPA